MRIYPFLSSFAFRLFLLLPFQIKKQQTTDDNCAADKGSHPRHLMQKQKTHQGRQQRRKEHKVCHLACFFRIRQSLRPEDTADGIRDDCEIQQGEKMLRLSSYHLPKALHSRKAEPQRCSKHAETGDLCGGIAHGNQLSCHNVIACPGSGRKKHPEHCRINGKRAMTVPKQKNHNT